MEDYLEKYHEKTLRTFLPVMVVIAIICVLGILGNAFTIAFYGFASRKSPTVFMITALACVDMIVCVLIVPNMAEMGVNVKYTNVAACKTMHFFGHWVVETSVLILWFISIDRYRHICCPFQSQVNYVKAKWAVGIIILVSFLLSVRDLANFDTIEVSIPNAMNITAVGRFCTTTEEPKYRLSVKIFHTIDALTIVMVLVTLCVTYSRIIWTINKGGFTAGSRKQPDREGPSVSKTTEEGLTETTTSTTNSPKYNKTPATGKNNMNAEKRKSPSTEKIKKTERSITLMMFAVSLNFALCFIPYFIVKLGIRSYKQASQLELGVGVQLAIRLAYMNSFANPYIFCIFNPQFRRFIRHTISLRKGSVFSQSYNIGTEDTPVSPQHSVELVNRQ